MIEAVPDSDKPGNEDAKPGNKDAKPGNKDTRVEGNGSVINLWNEFLKSGRYDISLQGAAESNGDLDPEMRNAWVSYLAKRIKNASAEELERLRVGLGNDEGDDVKLILRLVSPDPIVLDAYRALIEENIEERRRILYDPIKRRILNASDPEELEAIRLELPSLGLTANEMKDAQERIEYRKKELEKPKKGKDELYSKEALLALIAGDRWQSGRKAILDEAFRTFAAGRMTHNDYGEVISAYQARIAEFIEEDRQTIVEEFLDAIKQAADGWQLSDIRSKAEQRLRDNRIGPKDFNLLVGAINDKLYVLSILRTIARA